MAVLVSHTQVQQPRHQRQLVHLHQLATAQLLQHATQQLQQQQQLHLQQPKQLSQLKQLALHLPQLAHLQQTLLHVSASLSQQLLNQILVLHSAR